MEEKEEGEADDDTKMTGTTVASNDTSEDRWRPIATNDDNASQFSKFSVFYCSAGFYAKGEISKIFSFMRRCENINKICMWLHVYCKA